MTTEKQIKEAIETADQAFWNSVADSFPTITTGDFPPEACLKFEQDITDAVRQWLEVNKPTEADTAYFYIEEEVFTTMDQLGNYCAEVISPENWGIHAEVIIYRGDDLGHGNGILQQLDLIIMGAEEFNAAASYISSLLEVYTEWGHLPIVRVNTSGYMTIK